jgi:hypothetical protein
MLNSNIESGSGVKSVTLPGSDISAFTGVPCWKVKVKVSVISSSLVDPEMLTLRKMKGVALITAAPLLHLNDVAPRLTPPFDAKPAFKPLFAPRAAEQFPLRLTVPANGVGKATFPVTKPCEITIANVSAAVEALPLLPIKVAVASFVKVKLFKALPSPMAESIPFVIENASPLANVTVHPKPHGVAPEFPPGKIPPLKGSGIFPMAVAPIAPPLQLPLAIEIASAWPRTEVRASSAKIIAA